MKIIRETTRAMLQRAQTPQAELVREYYSRSLPPIYYQRRALYHGRIANKLDAR